MEKGRVGSEIWENPSLEHSRGSLEFQQLSLDWGQGHSWEFLQEQRPQKLLWEVSDSLGKTGKFQRKIHLNQTFCFWGFYLIWVSSLIPNTILRNPSLLLPFRISSQTWREQNHLCAHRKTSQERKKRGKKKIPFLGNQNSPPGAEIWIREWEEHPKKSHGIPSKARLYFPFSQASGSEGDLERLERRIPEEFKADQHSLDKSLENSQSLSPSSKAALLFWKSGNCFPFITQSPWNNPDLFLQSMKMEFCQEFFCSREFSHISTRTKVPKMPQINTKMHKFF